MTVVINGVCADMRSSILCVCVAMWQCGGVYAVIWGCSRLYKGDGGGGDGGG